MKKESELSFINLPYDLFRLSGCLLERDFKIFLDNSGLMYHKSNFYQQYVTDMIVNPEKFMLFKIKHGDMLEKHSIKTN